MHFFLSWDDADKQVKEAVETAAELYEHAREKWNEVQTRYIDTEEERARRRARYPFHNANGTPIPPSDLAPSQREKMKAVPMDSLIREGLALFLGLTPDEDFRISLSDLKIVANLGEHPDKTRISPASTFKKWARRKIAARLVQNKKDHIDLAPDLFRRAENNHLAFKEQDKIARIYQEELDRKTGPYISLQETQARVEKLRERLEKSDHEGLYLSLKEYGNPAKWGDSLEAKVQIRCFAEEQNLLRREENDRMWANAEPDPERLESLRQILNRSPTGCALMAFADEVKIPILFADHPRPDRSGSKTGAFYDTKEDVILIARNIPNTTEKDCALSLAHEIRHKWQYTHFGDELRAAKTREERLIETKITEADAKAIEALIDGELNPEGAILSPLFKEVIGVIGFTGFLLPEAGIVQYYENPHIENLISPSGRQRWRESIRKSGLLDETFLRRLTEMPDQKGSSYLLQHCEIQKIQSLVQIVASTHRKTGKPKKDGLNKVFNKKTATPTARA